MASKREELFRGLVEAWNEGGPAASVGALGPDFEFSPDPRFPDIGEGTFKGEELQRWMEGWASAWEDSELEILDFTDHGDAVTAICTWHIRGNASGIAPPAEDFTFVAWFDEDDRPLKAKAFFEHERALAEL